MKTLLVCSSKTGNTWKVAAEAERVFGVACVRVEDEPPADGCDLVVAGYWVDRGQPDAKMKAYLGALRGKRVALFATLGADPHSQHAQDALRAGREALGEGCTCVDAFLCQGRVDPALVEPMAKMFSAGHPHAMTPERRARIAEAAKHPDEKDLSDARAFFMRVKASLQSA